MPANFRCELLITQDCLYVDFKGKVSIADIKHCYQYLFDVADRHKVNKLFKDFRELEFDFESLELLQLMKLLKHDFKRFKVARLVSMQGHKQMLIQQIATNEKLAMQNFYCKNQAMHWLN